MACASHILRDDARSWWGVVIQRRDIRGMSSEDFQEVFNEKYFNDAVKEAKLEEFCSLARGSLSVTDYAQKFDSLAKFVPYIVLLEFWG